jgi:Protein of unknown function (DUF1593)
MALLILIGISLTAGAASPVARGCGSRMVVLTDIEADPDDTQSLVRLVLYSNEIELQGLVATTSVWRRSDPMPDSIRAVLRAYGQVHGNLIIHDPAYPKPEALMAIVTQGQPEFGMAAVGTGKDTDGSNLILSRLEDDDPRPLWVTIWGGSNTLAQTLFKLRATKSSAEVDRLVARLRVHAISDQDDSGAWIREHFPTLFYIVSPGGNYARATWGGIHVEVPGFDNVVVSNAWIAANIQQGHGPLGAVYPDVAWGMEGDTPSWLGLIPNGLNAPEHPNWGGWGGRYEFELPKLEDPPGSVFGGVTSRAEVRPIWTNAIDTFVPMVAGDYGRAVRGGSASLTGFQTTLWRWRTDFQNDFAARMLWTTRPYAQANHPPVPALDHSDRLTVHGGEGFRLSARGTADPDGDSLSYCWSQYFEAGSLPVKVSFGAENTRDTWVVAPKVDKTGTVHIILRVTDKGSPALSRYRRVIVTILP